MSDKVRVAMIGCGGMARHHVRGMLEQQDTTQIVVCCEPSDKNYQALCEDFEDAGVKPPPNVPELDTMLTNYASLLDAVFIITPHIYHYDQSVACLEAGLDVLLEKPMVMTADEAKRLIEVRDRTGKLLVVAFQGSLSPQVRHASRLLRSGEMGDILNISATVWQNWYELSEGTWRAEPKLAGGGFLFDTGAHMLNTVSDLAGENFVEVAAWMNNDGAPVDLRGVIIGRLASGAMVTMNACGRTIPSCTSDVKVFCTDAIIRTGVWGGFLEIQRHGDEDLEPVELPPMRGAWEQFVAVVLGEIENPSPPEIGLRMAHLWDAIRESAGKGGIPVKPNYA